MSEQRATYADVWLALSPIERVVHEIQTRADGCPFCRKRREIGMAKFEARKERERRNP